MVVRLEREKKEKEEELQKQIEEKRSKIQSDISKDPSRSTITSLGLNG